MMKKIKNEAPVLSSFLMAHFRPKNEHIMLFIQSYIKQTRKVAQKSDSNTLLRMLNPGQEMSFLLTRESKGNELILFEARGRFLRLTS